MKAISWIMWLEIVLLVALLLAFAASAMDAKTFAYATIGMLVVFTIPAAKSAVDARTDGEVGHG